MGFAELRAMAFVKDEHHAFVLHSLQRALEPVAGNRGVQLLDGGDDQLVVARQLLDQRTGIVRAVNRAITEMVEFLGGLIVQVAAVDDEDDFVHLGVLNQHLRSLEAGQCLARARRVPDIAILAPRLHPLDNRLDREILIGPQHHQHLVAFVQDDVFADHF